MAKDNWVSAIEPERRRRAYQGYTMATLTKTIGRLVNASAKAFLRQASRMTMMVVVRPARTLWTSPTGGVNVGPFRPTFAGLKPIRIITGRISHGRVGHAEHRSR
jgi:hypothetical protein